MPNLRSISSLVAFSLITLAGSSLPAQSFTFGAPHSISLPSSALSYPIGLDMNGDGNKDVYLQLKTGDYVYLADGKGNLSSTPIKVYESATGFLFPPVFYDVNGDGLADEIYYYPGYSDQYPGDSYNGVFAVLLGDGKGNFTETTNLSLSTFSNGYPNGVLAEGDFNGDGKPDFAAIGFTDPQSGEGRLDVFINSGAGHFQFGYEEPLDSFDPTALLRGDFNGDGKEDLVYVGSNAQNQPDIHCLYGNGKGSFTDQVCYTLDASPAAFASADFNRDGKTDLVVSFFSPQGSGSSNTSLATLLADDGGFTLSSSVVQPGAYPGSLQIAEMNGDGKPDVIYDGDYIFKNDGKGVFSTAQRVPETEIFIAIVKDALPASIDITTNGTVLVYRLNTSKP